MIIGILKSLINVKGLIIAPKPINTHKFIIFEPITFPTNNSVSFFLADIILVIISGKDVPIATIVIPINLSVNPNLLAISIELSTTKSAPNFKPNIPKIKNIIIFFVEYSSFVLTLFAILSSIFLLYITFSSYIE